MVDRRLEQVDRLDFISALAWDKKLDLKEIKENAQILTMAGYATTATALAGTTPDYKSQGDGEADAGGMPCF